jgi:hypothetical protein
MTAKDELRNMLDGLGVEHTDLGGMTEWTNGRGRICRAYTRNEPLTVDVAMLAVPPEQAIAATLGGERLTAEQVCECVETVYLEGYSDGSANRGAHIDETDWQAIADELNATVGAGTCRNISKVTDARKRKVRFVCSECDAWIDSEFIWNHEYSNGESPWVKDCKLNYCPNCGRRIEDGAE